MPNSFNKYIINPTKTVTGYIGGKIRLSNLPSAAAIEVTNLCNFNCVICSRRYSERPLGTMNMQLFTKIVEQIKHSTRFMWLHLLGEPLLNPEIFEMIAFCKKNKLKVGLSTNAMLLSQDKSEKLLNSGLDSCILAFDGVNKETYEKVRVGGVYEQVEENIINFLALKKKMKACKPWTVIQTVEINLTQNELDDFKNKWRYANVNEILIRKYSTSAGQIGDKDIVAQPKHRYLSEQKTNRPPCFLLWNSAVIFWNGEVSVCCHDCVNGKLVFGDLKKESLKDIWNSPKIVALRRQHVLRQFSSICQDCLEYPLFEPSVSCFIKLGINRIIKKIKFLGNKEKRFISHAREQSFR